MIARGEAWLTCGAAVCSASPELAVALWVTVGGRLRPPLDPYCGPTIEDEAREPYPKSQARVGCDYPTVWDGYHAWYPKMSENPTKMEAWLPILLGTFGKRLE